MLSTLEAAAPVSDTKGTVKVSEAQLQQFEQDGYVCVRGLFTDTETAELRDTFMTMNQAGPVPGLSEMRLIKVGGTDGEYDPADPLAFYPRMMNAHNHPDKPVGPLSIRYMTHPKLAPLLAALFKEEPLAVQSMFYFKPPGARGQDLHQDNFYLKVKPGTCVAAWVAVDDVDEENGGMMCVPNTQSYPIQCPEISDPKLYFTTEHVEPPAGTKPEYVRMKAGDVLFFNGNVIHGSTPNVSTTRFRRSFICHYVPRSTAEMSHWYTAYTFDGQKIDVRVNQDGGPCGTPREATAPH